MDTQIKALKHESFVKKLGKLLEELRLEKKIELGLKDDDFLEMLRDYDPVTFAKTHMGTIGEWEDGTRKFGPPFQYAAFFVERFHYNPFYLLLISDEKHITEPNEKDFAKIDKILQALDENKSMIIAVHDGIKEKSPGLLREAYLRIFDKHPEIYKDCVRLVETFERFPDLFKKQFFQPLSEP